MSEAGENHLPQGWTQHKLAELRRLLMEEGDWPAGAFALADDLNLPPTSPDIEEMEQMLSIVIDDALNGIDISQRYPAFYRQMLRDEKLFQAFLESLEILGAEQEIILPEPPSLDLSFLHRAQPQPEVSQISSGHWRVQWQQTIQQLQSLFQMGSLLVSFRDDPWLEDDGWQTLLRSEVLLVDVQLDMLLEAQRPQNLEDDTSLALTVTRIRPEDDWPEMRAIIEWGDYRQTVTLTEEGRVALPPLLPDMILDKSGQIFRADLRLILDVAMSH